MRRFARRLLIGFALAAVASCVSAPKAPKPPAFPAYAAPVIPDSVRATAEVRERHEAAWQRLQAGDVRGAASDYTECLRLSPTFYPAAVGLGFVALANRDFKGAIERFRSAVDQDGRYVPAWRGLVDAELGADRTDEAIAALERLLALDGSREADRSRLELLRLKQVQTLVESARRATDAGRPDEADRLLGQALQLSPRSSLVLRELALVEMRVGELDKAEAHARQAVGVEPWDAKSHATLASVLEAQGRLTDAAAALAQAASLDPALRDRAAAARAQADAAVAPAEMRDLGSRTSITRAQLAALIGMRLQHVLARNPRTLPVVATDVRSHWAAPWIVAVTQAGVMEVFANHTFQPASTVRRADLAQAIAALVPLAAAGRPDQLSGWQRARPAFADLTPANLLYPAAALAVAAGAMTANGGQFEPTRAATGAEALAAVVRIDELAGPRFAMTVLTAANQLTLLRLLLVPVFALCMLYGRPGWALVTFVVAGVTDALDGWIARHTGPTTVGAWLDPMADKLLLATMFVMLTLPGLGLVARIPLWLTVLVISRDIAIVLTVAIFNLAVARRTFRPSPLGKAATAIYILTGVVTLYANYDHRALPLVDVCVYLTLAITLLSGFEYLYRMTRGTPETSA